MMHEDSGPLRIHLVDFKRACFLSFHTGIALLREQFFQEFRFVHDT